MTRTSPIRRGFLLVLLGASTIVAYADVWSFKEFSATAAADDGGSVDSGGTQSDAGGDGGDSGHRYVATAVAVGASHSCAVVQDGQVLCWGDGLSGEIGTDIKFASKVPKAVPGLNRPATALALGASFSCALETDGTVQCWGAGESGQLGDGLSAAASAMPRTVLVKDATSITAAAGHACAVVPAGAVCWGDNGFDVLGLGPDASAGPKQTPQPVAGLQSVIELETSDTHTCAMGTDGYVFCWGDNHYGELGSTGPSTSSATSTGFTGNLAGDSHRLAIGSFHSCALGVDSVYCWGEETSGRLGDGDKLTSGPRPIAPLKPRLILESITAGQASSCGIQIGGAVWCWGKLAGVDNPTAAMIMNFTAKAIASQRAHTCAISTAGKVYCWGDNSAGQLRHWQGRCDGH